MHGSDTAPMADRGLEAAVARVNSAYAARYLYRPTRGTVTKVSPESFPPNSTLNQNPPVPFSRSKHQKNVHQVIQMGPDAIDLLLSFTIKETQCAKGSAADVQGCAFRPGFFVVRHFKGYQLNHGRVIFSEEGFDLLTLYRKEMTGGKVGRPTQKCFKFELGKMDVRDWALRRPRLGSHC